MKKWRYWNKYCYYFSRKRLRNWREANSSCSRFRAAELLWVEEEHDLVWLLLFLSLITFLGFTSQYSQNLSPCVEKSQFRKMSHSLFHNIHLTFLLCIPYLGSLLSRKAWNTLSKVLLKSRYTVLHQQHSHSLHHLENCVHFWTTHFKKYANKLEHVVEATMLIRRLETKP